MAKSMVTFLTTIILLTPKTITCKVFYYNVGFGMTTTGFNPISIKYYSLDDTECLGVCIHHVICNLINIIKSQKLCMFYSSTYGDIFPQEGMMMYSTKEMEVIEILEKLDVNSTE